MKMSKVSFFAVLCSGMLYADYVDVSVWKRLSDKGNEQFLVLCGDKHNLMDSGIYQAEEIVKHLSARNNKNDYIMIEDLNDIEGFGKRVDAFFDVYPNKLDREKALQETSSLREGIEGQRKECVDMCEHDALFVLPYLARKKNISVDNIDFRTFVSCGTMRFNTQAYENGRLIIPHLVESLVQEIATYNDAPVLNKRYAEIVERYTPFMNYICKIMRDNNIIFQDLIAYLVDTCLANPEAFNPVFVESVRTVDLSWNLHHFEAALDQVKKGDTSEKVCAELRSNLYNLLTLSSAELFDARALHALYTKQIDVADGNTVFMCAGKAHNAIVAQELSHFGYVLVDQVIDEHGVDMAKVCASLISTSKPVVTVWSYVIDTVDAVAEYVSELFV
jgi:hypothetical protein